ncbi:MAG: LysM peptidoglycan-binding domain-containing protein [Candidatus Adiutrix sp.]
MVAAISRWEDYLMSGFKSFVVLTLWVFLTVGASVSWAQEVAKPYVVERGDTAASIAQKFYGKSSLGPKLWQANRNLVANPQRLTAGDTIFIFPESTLAAGKATAVPPPPAHKPQELYQRGTLLSTSFPKYFTFLADGRGLGASGTVRMKVKRMDRVEGDEFQELEQLYEVRDVGEIFASTDRGGSITGDGADKAKSSGKLLLSTSDMVIIRFTEDLAKILDSETYGDSDPYFREFPIYGVGLSVQETMRNRADHRRTAGELYRYKGLVTIVSRIEGLAPLSQRDQKKLKSRKGARNQDVEPASYVGRITYSEDVLEINDRVFVFVELEPGLERRLDAPFVEPAGTYNSLQ